MTFTAPTNFEECKALMGTTIATPTGAFECTGASGQGRNDFGINFRAGNLSWDNVNGWQTAAERKAAQWNKAWNKLPNNARDLISFTIGNALGKVSMDRRADVQKCLRIAKRSLIKAGKIEMNTCGRCGGTGKFSFNQITGSVCFGCNGAGKLLPSTSACLKVAK